MPVDDYEYIDSPTEIGELNDRMELARKIKEQEEAQIRHKPRNGKLIEFSPVGGSFNPFAKKCDPEMAQRTVRNQDKFMDMSFLDYIKSKYESWKNEIGNCEAITRWQVARTLYGTSNPTSYYGEGDYNERKISSNHYRLNADKLANNTAYNDVNWSITDNSQEKTPYSTIKQLSELMEFYSKEKNMMSTARQTNLNSILFGTGWSMVEWDESTQSLCFKSLTPDMVIHEVNDDPAQELRWILVCRKAPPVEVIRKFPDKKEKIIEHMERRGMSSSFSLTNQVDIHTDSKKNGKEIEYWEFYHVQDPQSDIPNGRKLCFLSDGEPLCDYEFPLSVLPLSRQTSYHFPKTNIGSSVLDNTINLQMLIDEILKDYVDKSLYSSSDIIVMPDSVDYTVETMEENKVTIIKYPHSTTKPEIKNISLRSDVSENVKMVELLGDIINKTQGLSEIFQGETSSSIRSATGQALQLEQARYSIEDLTSAYYGMIRKLGTAALFVLKENAQDAIEYTVGNKRTSLDRESLPKVPFVSIDNINAVANTPAGKRDMLDYLSDHQIITKASQKVDILQHGNINKVLSKMTETMNSIREAIDEIITSIEDGFGVPSADKYDDHDKWTLELIQAIEKEKAKGNRELVVSGLRQRFNEHVAKWKETTINDPDFYLVSGWTPFPFPQQAAPQEPPPPNKGGSPPNPSGDGGVIDPREIASPSQKVDDVKQKAEDFTAQQNLN